MAWEWVSPAATAMVGGAGIFFTYRTGREARDHAASLAAQQVEHAKRSAADALEQQRKAETYIRCLEVAEQVSYWAQSVRPVLDTNPPREPPALPSLQEQFAAKARLSAFGSREVSALWESWQTVVGDVRHADFAIGLALGNIEARGGTGIDHMAVWSQLEDVLRPAERERRQLLADRMRLELAGLTGVSG